MGTGTSLGPFREWRLVLDSPLIMTFTLTPSGEKWHVGPHSRQGTRTHACRVRKAPAFLRSGQDMLQSGDWPERHSRALCEHLWI